MVRIVSLAAILASCLSPVLAITDGTYWIKRYGGFMTESQSNRVIYSTYVPSSVGQQWFVQNKGDGTVTIENLSSGHYAGGLEDEDGAPVVGLDEAYKFNLESTEDPIAYAIRSGAAPLYVNQLNGVGSTLVLQSNSAPWVFYDTFPGKLPEELKAR